MRIRRSPASLCSANLIRLGGKFWEYICSINYFFPFKICFLDISEFCLLRGLFETFYQSRGDRAVRFKYNNIPLGYGAGRNAPFYFIFILQSRKFFEHSSIIFYNECSNLGDAIHHLADCLKEDKQYDFIFGDLTDVPIDTDHTSKTEPHYLNT